MAHSVFSNFRESSNSDPEITNLRPGMERLCGPGQSHIDLLSVPDDELRVDEFWLGTDEQILRRESDAKCLLELKKEQEKEQSNYVDQHDALNHKFFGQGGRFEQLAKRREDCLSKDSTALDSEFLKYIDTKCGEEFKMTDPTDLKQFLILRLAEQNGLDLCIKPRKISEDNGPSRHDREDPRLKAVLLEADIYSEQMRHRADVYYKQLRHAAATYYEQNRHEAGIYRERIERLLKMGQNPAESEAQSTTENIGLTNPISEGLGVEDQPQESSNEPVAESTTDNINLTTPDSEEPRVEDQPQESSNEPVAESTTDNINLTTPDSEEPRVEDRPQESSKEPQTETAAENIDLTISNSEEPRVEDHPQESPHEPEAPPQMVTQVEGRDYEPHPTPGIERFLCPRRCGFWAQDAPHLQTHAKTCNGHMQYACKVCDWRCNCASAVPRHMKKYHPREEASLLGGGQGRAGRRQKARRKNRPAYSPRQLRKQQRRSSRLSRGLSYREPSSDVDSEMVDPGPASGQDQVPSRPNGTITVR